jgi:hypothetical protein
VFTASETLLKEWVELCYKVMILMRREMGFSLHRTFGTLPGMVFEAIRRGVRPEDQITLSQTKPKAYTTEHPDINPAQVESFTTEPVDVHSPEAKKLLEPKDE